MGIRTRVVAVGALLLAVACRRDDMATPERYQGLVELEERNLGFELTARLREVLVHEGQDVTPGQELATVDDSVERANRAALSAQARAAHAELALLLAGTRPEDVRALKADLRSAVAAEQLATTTAEREQRLFKTGAATEAARDAAVAAAEQAVARRQSLDEQVARATRGSRVEQIDEARARAEAADAQVKASDEKLARHRLVADQAGQVVEVLLSPGELALAGAPALIVADIHRPYVDVFVPQAEIARVALGAPAELRVDSLDHALTGTVEIIARRAEFAPRFLFSKDERMDLVLRVRVRIADPRAELRGGTPAFVSIGSRT